MPEGVTKAEEEALHEEAVQYVAANARKRLPSAEYNRRITAYKNRHIKWYKKGYTK